MDSLCIRFQPSRESDLIQRICRESHDRLRRILFSGLKLEAVEFQKQNADHETGPLVAIEKWMVEHNTRCINGRHVGDAGCFRIGVMLVRTSKSRLKQSLISNACSAAVDSYHPGMDSKRIALINPKRFFLLLFRHLERTWRVFR